MHTSVGLNSAPAPKHALYSLLSSYRALITVCEFCLFASAAAMRIHSDSLHPGVGYDVTVSEYWAS